MIIITLSILQIYAKNWNLKNLTFFEILRWVLRFFFRNLSHFFFQLFDQFYNLGTAEELSKKQKSIDAKRNAFKRSKSNIQNFDKVKRDKNVNNRMTSFYFYNENLFDNHIFRCLIISSHGWAIYNFKLSSELLKALRDAIKEHRSLYTTGKILHRDISENNIIITNSKDADANGFKSMLINENLVKEVSTGQSGARHQIDIIEFIAIQMLQRVVYTYRYDLELFFYVLLWIYACYA